MESPDLQLPHHLLARVPALRQRSVRQRLQRLISDYHVQRLAFFGSILGAEYTDDSDVDVLIEFEPGNSIGLLGLSQFQLELSDLFGLPVDARTLPELSHYFRERIAQEALEFYAA